MVIASESTGYEPFAIDYTTMNDIVQTYPDGIAKDYLQYSLDKYANIFRDKTILNREVLDKEIDTDDFDSGDIEP